jgi:chromosome segregation ATPase
MRSDFNQGVMQERFVGGVNTARARRDADDAAASSWAWKARAEQLEKKLLNAQGQLNQLNAKVTTIEVTKDAALDCLEEAQSALAKLSPNHPLANAEAARLRRRAEIDRKLMGHGIVLDRSNPDSIKIITV